MSTRADTVFTNGAVFDGHEYQPQSAVAVAGGRIVAVGGEDFADLVGPRTEMIDVGGALLLPGFTDAHIHPIEGGLERMRCDLSAGENRAEYRSLIRRYCVETDAPWILGGGWQLAAFPGGVPLASELDQIVSDRPVFLSSRDHHAAWVNTRALEMAGITAATDDPPDGCIERDRAGNPTGVLQEGARLLVSRMIPEDTATENYQALLAAQSYLHTFGITGWQDALVGDYGNHSDTGDVYLEAAQNGDLTAKVIAALWWDRNRGVEQLAELVHRRGELQHERFAATSVKIMQDGIPENRTAAMLEPYCGSVGSGTSGHSFIDPVELKAVIAAVDLAGFQAHVHAIGDRAVRESLDAFETALSLNGSNDHRHHLAHLQIVHSDDVPRFAALGVTANLQALWASFDPQMVELNLPVLGAERSARQYPFGDLARAGSRLCAGSDWPVTTPDPWAALHVAVNRTLPASMAGFNPEPFYPQQALGLTTALRAYTQGSAWINHSSTTGVIAVGAAADLCVTDRDPFTGPPSEIGATRVVSTWIDGRRVFGA
ncbi:amidohydrolase [Glaciibacter sp. 2TAF33]|uniref:amidohydrolase n=1 Tax=Glaciibacter sp. 2TAF33 TaxID=3233015 RepID=UPI003F928F5F